MGTVLLLIVLFFSTIFIYTYQNIERNSDEMLYKGLNERPKPVGNVPPHEWDIRQTFSPTFVVEIDSDKNISKIISSFNTEDGFYEAVTKEALSKNKESDKIKYNDAYFKYRIVDNKIVFLDVSKDVQMLESMLYIFFMIAIPMLAIIFFISLYFSKRSIKPIEVSYNKQKEFIADASHELKTPLATIRTNVDVLLEGASVEQAKWLSYIKSETDRMASLTGSLLYLTRMDYKDTNEQMKRFDFSNLIQDYLMPLEAIFYENKIKTDIKISPNIEINGDSEQIRRMVGILIDNAIKFTDGKIGIMLEKVQNSAKLTVYNTGLGIEKEELPKIWDRFYRGDKSREYTGGFGLGLPIAKAIAQSHKGGITAESNINEWTKFIVKLPLA